MQHQYSITAHSTWSHWKMRLANSVASSLLVRLAQSGLNSEHLYEVLTRELDQRGVILGPQAKASSPMPAWAVHICNHLCKASRSCDTRACNASHGCMPHECSGPFPQCSSQGRLSELPGLSVRMSRIDDLMLLQKMRTSQYSFRLTHHFPLQHRSRTQKRKSGGHVQTRPKYYPLRLTAKKAGVSRKKMPRHASSARFWACQ